MTQRRTGASTIRQLRQKFRADNGSLDYTAQMKREAKLLMNTHFKDLVERCVDRARRGRLADDEWLNELVISPRIQPAVSPPSAESS